MFGGKPPRGLPKPPPPLYGAWNWRLSHVEKRQIELPKRQNGSPETPEWGRGRDNSGTFQITQHWSNISRCFLCVFLSLSLLQCQIVPIFFLCAVRRKRAFLYSEAEPIKGCVVMRENMAYIVNESLWKGTKTGRQPSVDYTPFYRQHLCGGQCIQEQSRPQQHMWNSRLFVIFPAEITAEQCLHFQHLMWTEDVKTSIVKRSLSLAMFLSTS